MSTPAAEITTAQPLTMAEHFDITKRIQAGEITVAEILEAFERFLPSRESIFAEMMKRPLKEFSGMRKGNNKAHTLRMALSGMIGEYAAYESVSYQYDFKPDSTAYEDGVRRAIAKLTDEGIKAAADERKARRAETLRAINNPERWEDFEIFLYYRKSSDMTTEQRENFERLKTERGQGRREEEQERRAAVRAVELDGVAMTLKEGWHTKHNCKLWIVQLSERVERSTFEELAQKSRMLGGNYSSFGSAENRGFQFRDEESANKFMSLKDGNVDRSEEVREHRADMIDNAAERLRTVAENLNEKAEESLSHDRKQNTHRQASMAASAAATARRQQAMAATLQRVADAIENGTAPTLRGVRAVTHVETLEQVLQRAKYDSIRSKEKRTESGYSYTRREEYDRAPEHEDIAHAEFPFPRFDRGDCFALANDLADKPGFKNYGLMFRRLAAKMPEQYSDAPRISNPHFLDRVRECAKRARKRSGMGRAAYLYENRTEDLERLFAANITNDAELRTALREYLPLREGAAVPDPIEALERDLIGCKIPGFFPTPRPLIDRMIEEAQICEGMTVLEPSAGKGDIADALQEIEGVTVDVCEVSSTLRAILEHKGYTPAAWDFFDLDASRVYDRVVMNPPFESGLDMEHVKAAYARLKDGGRLVAIMSEGPFYRSDKKAAAFCSWLDEMGGTSEELPAGSFTGRDSFRQTSVNTRLVVLTK